MKYQLNEGHLHLPSDLVDHSVNIFKSTTDSTNIVLTRQKIEGRQTTNEVVANHIESMKQSVDGYRVDDRKALGIGDQSFETIGASWSMGGQRMLQRQVFIEHLGVCIIVTVTSDEVDERSASNQLLSILNSFKPRLDVA